MTPSFARRAIASRVIPYPFRFDQSKRGVLLAAAFAAISAVRASSVRALDWTAGGSGDWGTATNWSPWYYTPYTVNGTVYYSPVYAVPNNFGTNHFSATIAQPSTPFTVAMNGNYAIDALTMTAAAVTLTNSGSISVSGVGSQTITGNFNNSGTFNYSAPNSWFLNSATMNNAGVINYSAANGYYWYFSGGTLNNLAAGTVNNACYAVITYNVPNNFVNNYGTWNQLSNGYVSLSAFNNYGSVVLAPGVNASFANVVSSGSFSGSPSCTVTFTETTTLAPSSSFSGPSLVISSSFAAYTPVNANAIAVTAGAASFNAPVNASSLSVGNNLTLRFLAPSLAASYVSVVGTLTLANNGAAVGSRTYSGTIDLTTNDLIVRSGSESDLRNMVQYFLVNSSHGLRWSVVSTNSYTSLAVATNSDGTGQPLYPTFDGITSSATDVLVKYTYLGDTDLTGSVDAADLANLLAGMNGHLTGWINGDMNYDGVINGADLALLIDGLSGQGAPLGGIGRGGGGSVPEPSGVVVGAVVLGASLRRSRRGM